MERAREFPRFSCEIKNTEEFWGRSKEIRHVRGTASSCDDIGHSVSIRRIASTSMSLVEGAQEVFARRVNNADTGRAGAKGPDSTD